MKAIRIKPGEDPELIDLQPGLKPLQDEVGGYIQGIYPWDSTEAAFVNDDGKHLGLPMNKIATAACRSCLQPGDYISGTMIVTGISPRTGDCCNLRQALINELLALQHPKRNT